ncbi:MAG: class I SAM-dependent methyltransferase [Anaerolineales bacterium]|nr:class I SAM-dependent methyltransferase [Anaerolineales bacterium]
MKSLTIKELYPLALAEGEGVGTAYEYFAKRLALRRWLGQGGEKTPRPCHILIAGLPQKYGSSLDFFLLASELGAELTVVDDRPEAIAKGQRSLAAAQEQGFLPALVPNWLTTADLPHLPELTPAQPFDLVLSSEVLQRLAPPERSVFVARLGELSTAVGLFAPNADNEAHVGRSGLGGITLAEMQALVLHPAEPSTYIDMPPFPPGITRSDEQREQATSGRLEALAMWGLSWYARLEKWFPGRVRRAYAHIVYGFSGHF